MQSSWQTILTVVFAVSAAVIFLPSKASGQSVTKAEFAKKFPEFTTTSGKTYAGKHVHKISPTGLTLITDTGVSKVKTHDLPENVLQFLGYDKKTATQAEKEEVDRKKKQQEKASKIKNANYLLEATEIKVEATILQKSDDGFLCSVQALGKVSRVVTRRKKGSTLAPPKERRGRTYLKRVTAEMGVGEAQEMYIRGLPARLRTKGTWKGTIYLVGSYSYASLVGEEQSVLLAYSDKGMARKFLVEQEPDPSISGDSSGTGFAISADGYLATALHVVADSEEIQVECNGVMKPAKVVARDEERDLAILKVDARLKAVAIGDSDDVALGADVFTVGFPNLDIQGREPKLTKGDINALTGLKDDDRHFQISVPIQPGNSGGALYEENGSVIGIVVQKLSDSFAVIATGQLPQNVNYAVKSFHLLQLMQSVDGLVPDRSDSSKDPFVRAQDAALLIEARR